MVRPFRGKRLQQGNKTYLGATAYRNKQDGLWYPFIIMGSEYLPVQEPYVTKELAQERAYEIGQQVNDLLVRLKILNP